MKKKKSFRVSILQTFSVLLLITASGISVNFYMGSSEAVLKLSDQVTEQVTGKIIERLGNYLYTPAIQSQTVSQLVTSDDITTIYPKLHKYMWSQLMVLPQVQAIFVADQNGSYVQVRREPKLATRIIDRSVPDALEIWQYRNPDYSIDNEIARTPTFDPRKRPWFLNTKDEKRIYWTDVYVFTTAQTPGISATYPVLDERGNVSSVVCVNMPLHSLSDFLAEQYVSENGLVFITNAKGEIMAYPDRAQIIRRDEGSQKSRLAQVSEVNNPLAREAYAAYQNNGLEKFSTEINGQTHQVSVVSVPTDFISDWRILVIIPEDDLLGSVNRTLLISILIAFVIFLFTVGAVIFFSTRVSQPILDLAEQTRYIREFELENVTGVDSRFREVDVMSKSLVSTVQGLQSFRKYVPADIVRELLHQGREAKVGGEYANLAIMFTDVADFTRISENLPAEYLALHLADYFQAMSEQVVSHQGTIDKYIGDAVMAFWGAPHNLPNSPELACRTALACQRSLEERNAEWASLNKPIMHTRIGIHTGMTIVGNLGSQERLNYTVIGDSVNLAARLEGLNKRYGTHIIISDATYRQVGKHFICRHLDRVAVKGKVEGVDIYELVAEADEPIPKRRQDYIRYYEGALNCYFKRDWKKALEILEALEKHFPDDAAVQLQISNCRHYLNAAEPPPDGWNGVTMLDSK